jgi:hypothetical protein
MSMQVVQINAGNRGSLSVTSLFPRTPATGEPRTLPIGTLNPLLEGPPFHTAPLSGYKFPGRLT